MASSSFRDGKALFEIPSRTCETYYKIYGDMKSGAAPLVVLHGGPGSGHEYVEPFSELWHRYGIPVVFYDQIGCASSTHLPETAGDKSFWQRDLFLAELENLISHLGLDKGGTGYNVLGHSFGGYLAVAYAARQPPALRKLIIASTNASTETSRQSLWRLLKTMPSSAEHEDAIKEAIKTKDFTSPAYKDFFDKFYCTFVCRADPFPPLPLAKNQANQAADSTVRRTMQGQSPFLSNGSMEHWDNVPYLSKIKVPTLLYNGEFDTSQCVSMSPFFDHIATVRWITFPGAGHMAHLESEEMLEKILKVVGHFLKPF